MVTGSERASGRDQKLTSRLPGPTSVRNDKGSRLKGGLMNDDDMANIYKNAADQADDQRHKHYLLKEAYRMTTSAVIESTIRLNNMLWHEANKKNG